MHCAHHLPFFVGLWDLTPSRILGNIASALDDGMDITMAPAPWSLIVILVYRICPGIYLADTSIWINVAKGVAAFAVSKSKGPDGKEIVPVAESTSGVISYVVIDLF